MRTLIFIIVAMLFIGCSRDDVLVLEQYGYVDFKGSFYEPSLTSKYETPECSGKVPVSITYIFINELGFNFIRSATVQIIGNDISLVDEIRLPVGKYTVDDAALYAADGTLTHRIPSTQTTEFYFGLLTNVHTPFDIEIFPEQETNTSGEFVCYTIKDLELSGTLMEIGSIVDITTLYYELPAGSCIRLVVIEFDVDLSIPPNDIFGPKKILAYGGTGIIDMPILSEFTNMRISAFDIDNVLLVTPSVYTEYNPGPLVTYADVHQFGVTCN